MAMDVVGRDQELAIVERLLDERQAGPLAVIIEGDAGIGKTTLWEAALDLARDRSWRVLAARPAEAEFRFSYAAVRDLLGPLIDETIEGLPGPQRRAVEIAFLRAEGNADAHAASAGVLGILRSASAAGPVLVGIDDLQWLDAASARVLEFALRRLTMEQVGVVVASRPPRPGPVPLRLERAFGGRRIRRTLALAQYLFEAGDTTGARSELEALVAEMPPGPDRAQVLVRLAIVRYWAQSQPAGAACAKQAVAEAAPGTLTLAEAHALVAQLSHHSNMEREGHAQRAIELLGQQPDPDPRILSAALVGLAMARHYTGLGVSREVLTRAIELEESLAERPPVTWRAKANLGVFLKWADDFDGARVILSARRCGRTGPGRSWLESVSGPPRPWA